MALLSGRKAQQCAASPARRSSSGSGRPAAAAAVAAAAAARDSAVAVAAAPASSQLLLPSSAAAEARVVQHMPHLPRPVSPSSQLERSSSRRARGPHPPQARRRSPVIAPDISTGAPGSDEQSFVDLFNYLLRQRIVFLSGYVNDKLATQIVGSLLALDAMDSDAPIRLYINSPGGTPYSVVGVVDAMQAVKAPIATVALGACYSYSSLILAAGAKGQRHAMKNTRIMMTQPMGGSQGDIYAIAATVRELNAIYQLFCKYYMRFTAMSADEVEANTCRDTFMTPEQAVDAGLIDGVFAAPGDTVTPPAVVRALEEAGFVDRLSGGVLRTGSLL